jgi:NTE family protein
MKTALILAGAVAKGAFEAGVLWEIEQRGIEVSAVVSTSAGSLNGALYATGLRFNRTRLAVETLASLWREHAGWRDVVQPTLSGVIGGTGLSSTDMLQKLLFDGMQVVSRERREGSPRAVKLQLVTTNLSGATRTKDGTDGTTFEHVSAFSDAAFDTEDGRREIARAALASAAFPLLFVPVELPGVGPCVDGGTVNNTPINWAIEDGVERVIVVTGNPREMPKESHLHGMGLIGKEVDIAINERLFRDLFQARKVNKKLAELQKTFDAMSLGASERAQILDVLGWKPLELIEIRPRKPLAGNAFSALSDPALRAEYMESGQEAARSALP